VIRYTPEAEQQIDDLRIHYEKKERLEAARNLDLALEEAGERIIENPGAGLPAPRPYPRLKRPQLKRLGRAWIKAGRYCIAYSVTIPPVIVGVFYEQANIPRRF